MRPRDSRPRVWWRQCGQVMVVAVIGLTILLVLTMTLLSITLNMNGNARRRTREVQALAAAEAACSRGVSMLEQGMIAAVPYQQTNIALGRRSMDLRVVGLDAGTSGPYAIDRYEVRGTGHAGTVSCAVALGGRHDSFLRYSRFLGSAGVSYGAGASLTGQLYAGGNLDMAGSPVTFEEDVSLTGVVNNRTRGVFHRNVYEHAAPISLGASMDVATYRGLAQQHGMYYTAQATPPVIDFSLFDFTGSQPKYNGVGLGTGFNGIVFCEGDIAVKGVLEGRSVTVVAGSDVIISDNVRTGCSKSTFASATPLSFSAASGAESVQTVDLTGLMSGVSNSLKLKVSGQKWQRLNVYLKADGNTIGVGTVERPSGTTANLDSTTILAGRNLDPAAHQYTAEVHYWSTGVGAQTAQLEVAAGTPVNIGLLAKDYVYISQYAPRVLTVDAALFARDYNWRPIDESDTSDTDNSHPKCHGVWDLDQDGQIEANNQDGWDERNVGNSTWMLNINGPIITRNGGSAGAWEYQGSSQGKGTRHYNYDNDIVYYEPPDFPVILSRWAVLYWRRV